MDLAEQIQKDFHEEMGRLYKKNKKLKRADLFATCVYLKLAELEYRISRISAHNSQPA